MRLADQWRFNLDVVRGQRFRTAMVLLALVIGVAAVNVLTGLGEGARRFVLGEFSFLGASTLIVLPGRKETTGGMPPMLGNAPRELTLGDALTVARTPGVVRVAPLVVGLSEISAGGRLRESMVLGTTAEFFAIRQLAVRQGEALPEVDWDLSTPVAVIGGQLRRELFGSEPALGRWLRADNRRFRVIGVLEGKGVAMGNNLDEVLLVPVASAQALFNQAGLFRIFVEVRHESILPATRMALRERLTRERDGEEDFTLISQDAILSGFDRILAMLTLAVGGIAAISLAVAGVLIMNIMLISVTQRTAEIGLLKALGANGRLVARLILGEALLLALIGAVLGVGCSQLLLALGRSLYPDLPMQTPLWALGASVLLALGTAMVFAWLPARRAATMDPVQALVQGQGVG